MRPPKHLPKRFIKSFQKGETATEFLPGDFVLVFRDGFYSSLIRFGQSLRAGINATDFVKYTHVALIVDVKGGIIEANGNGVQFSLLSKYDKYFYTLVNIDANEHDRVQSVIYAKNCLNRPYGWGTIASIAVSLLTGLKFSFGFDGQEICSGLVAKALERTDAIFPRDPSHITPMELAKYYLNDTV